MIQNCIINAKWLKEFSLIPLNFNTKETENFIKLAETVWLEPVLGTPFYEELLDEVKNNQISSANSTALVEAIYPYIAMAVTYEALPSILYHISEVSITKGKSDTSDPLTLKEMTYYEQFVRRQLEARKDHCIKWLDSHWASFPLYVPSSCQCGAPTADKCVCGAIWGELHHPNKYQQLFAPRKKCVEIN